MSHPVIENATARALFLDRHGLAAPRTRTGRGAALADLISGLGFVQVDSVQTLARAHDMILFSRCTDYRPQSLRWLNDRSRDIFEAWTHDASVIPTEFYPYWRLKFARDHARLREKWADWHGTAFHAEIEDVLAHITRHGACCSRDIGEAPARKSTGWWDWKPSKAALEYLWRSGFLAVSHRAGFAKHYDLAERVIPERHFTRRVSEADTIDWACNAALDRLGFATSGEIAAFFALISPAEAKTWAANRLRAGELTEADILCADGSARRSFMRPETLDSLHEISPPARRLRLLSPFDPALRDRKRAERLFGFQYRIEIFVPEAKRKFGYYVFPILEAANLIGRIDLTADRAAGVLRVRALWPEKGVRFGAGRLSRLMRELDRAARFAQCNEIELAPDFLRAG